MGTTMWSNQTLKHIITNYNYKIVSIWALHTWSKMRPLTPFPPIDRHELKWAPRPNFAAFSHSQIFLHFTGVSQWHGRPMNGLRCPSKWCQMVKKNRSLVHPSISTPFQTLRMIQSGFELPFNYSHNLIWWYIQPPKFYIWAVPFHLVLTWSEMHNRSSKGAEIM